MIAPGPARPVFHGLDEPAAARTPPAQRLPLDPVAIEAALRDAGMAVVGPPPSAPGWGAHLSA